MTDDTEEQIEEVFKLEMKAAEKLEDCIDDASPDEIVDAAMDVAEDVLGEVESARREKYVYSTLFQIGRSVESEQLAQFAAGKLEEWIHTHGQQ